MPRPYKGHYLTEEQKKLAGDNINLVWWYIDQKLLRRNKIEPKEIDEVAGYLMWQLCMAAEGFNPELGYKFSTYAETAFRGGLFRYKQLKDPYEERFIVTDFVIHNDVGYGHHGDDFCDEPEYKPAREEKIIEWEDVKFLFDFIEMTPIEKQIVFLRYEQRLNFKDIGEIMRSNHTTVSDIHDGVVNRIKEEIKDKDFQLKDFYELEEAIR